MEARFSHAGHFGDKGYPSFMLSGSMDFGAEGSNFGVGAVATSTPLFDRGLLLSAVGSVAGRGLPRIGVRANVSDVNEAGANLDAVGPNAFHEVDAWLAQRLSSDVSALAHLNWRADGPSMRRVHADSSLMVAYAPSDETYEMAIEVENLGDKITASYTNNFAALRSIANPFA